MKHQCLILPLLLASSSLFPVCAVGSSLGLRPVAGGGPSGISATSARLSPLYVAATRSGDFYVAESRRVYRVSLAGILSPAAGTGGLSLDTGINGEDLPALEVVLENIQGIAVTPNGDLLIQEYFYQFVFNQSWRTIKRVDHSTGMISIVANDRAYGFGPEQCRASTYYLGRFSMAVGSDESIYITDEDCNRVYRNGVLIAGNGSDGFGGDGGPGVDALLSRPGSITVDISGNVFFVDAGSARIRRIDATTGVITSVAGNGSSGSSGDGGPALLAQIAPQGISVDNQSLLYIAEPQSNRVRVVDLTTGRIDLVAGSGDYGYSGDGWSASEARLASPSHISVDGDGNVFIVDLNNYTIRKRRASDGIMFTVAGGPSNVSLGDGEAASRVLLGGVGLFDNFGVSSLAADSTGNLYIATLGDRRVRRVDYVTGVITTVAGNGKSGFTGDGGLATQASIDEPAGLALDSHGNLFIADEFNQRIRRVDASTGLITTVAGSGRVGQPGQVPDGTLALETDLYRPVGVAVDRHGNIYIADNFGNRTRRLDAATGVISTFAGALGRHMAIDADDNLYATGICNCVYRIDADDRNATRFAGTGFFGFSGDGGPASEAQFYQPQGLAFDSNGNLYIADTGNHRIRKVLSGSTTVVTISGNGLPGISGNGGPALAAQLDTPRTIASDSLGRLFFYDHEHRVVRTINAGGFIANYAGGGPEGDGGPAPSAVLRLPEGVATDSYGNLYLADSANHVIRKIDADSGIIHTVAGGGPGGDGVPAILAALNSPTGITLDRRDNLFIAETVGNRIRRVDAATGIISTVAGGGQGSVGGPAAGARLIAPRGVAIDADGNLYLTSRQPGGNQRNTVLKVDAQSGALTYVGFGHGLDDKVALAIDHGGLLYALSQECVHRFDLVNNTVAVVAGICGVPGQNTGDGGPATGAVLSFPRGLAVDATGSVFIGTSSSRTSLQFTADVRRVDRDTGAISTVAQIVGSTLTIVADASGSVYIADRHNSRVLKIRRGNTAPIAVISGNASYECVSGFASVELDASGSGDADSTFGSNDDIIQYEWFEGFGTPSELSLGSGTSLNVQLPRGQHRITLRVTDTTGASNTDDLMVAVSDTQPPVLSASLDRLGVPGGGTAGRYVVRFSSTDACVGNPTIAAVLLGQGCEPEPTQDGQIFDFSPVTQGCSQSTDDGVMRFLSPTLVLRVTTGDGSENTRTIQVRLEGLGPDSDGDAIADALDCSCSDPYAWSAPSEVADLKLVADGCTLSWEPPLDQGGRLVAYDLLRSTRPWSFGSGATCLETNPVSSKTLMDSSVPQAGSSYFYEVRARNACPGNQGLGPLGVDSSGFPRTGRTCP